MRKGKFFGQMKWFVAMMLIVALVAGCSSGSGTTPAPSTPPAENPGQNQTEAPPAAPSMEELAKKEGSLVIYATGGSTAEAVVPAFNKMHPGINVQVVTLRGPEMSTRVDAEYASGQHIGDIVFTGPGSMLAFRNQNRFEKWDPEGVDQIIEGANDSQGHFWATYLNIYGMLINSDQLKDSEPKTWKDLLDPRFKEKVLMDDPRTQGGGQFFMIGASKDANLGWGYLEQLKGQAVFNRDRNESPRMVARGEYPVYAPQAVNDEITGILATGAPVKMIFPEDGAVYIPVQAGVLNKAPHPNAAKLFVEFMISEEGQVAMAQEAKVFPARKGMKGPEGWPDVSDLKFIPVVTEEDRNKNEEYVKRFEDTFFK